MTDDARGLLREVLTIHLHAGHRHEVKEQAKHCDLCRVIARITAHLAAPAPEPVARVTYSNWNGVNIEALPAGRCLPVGAELYALPLPKEEK